jgi:hypothetical protein
MKRYSALLFVVALFIPYIAFAQDCVDYAKIVIGFLLIVAIFNAVLFGLILGGYFLSGGRRLLKMWSTFIVIFLLLGVIGVTVGLIKEQSKNHIPLLHNECDPR